MAASPTGLGAPRSSTTIHGARWPGRWRDYLAYEQPYGVAPLLRRAIAPARARAEAAERQQVAAQVRLLLEKSGLMPAQFARRIGTSRSRLSTYRSGTVTPSAALLVRMGKVAEAAEDERLRRSGAET